MTGSRFLRKLSALIVAVGLVGSVSTAYVDNQPVTVLAGHKNKKKSHKLLKSHQKEIITTRSFGSSSEEDAVASASRVNVPDFTISIQTNSSVDTEATKAGIAAWNNTNSVNFNIVNGSSAKIIVVNDNYGKTDWVGETVLSKRNGVIVSATVKLNDYFMKKISRTARKATVEHELGHAIGLTHNSISNSVMYAEMDPDSPNLIRQCDIDNVKKLFNEN